MTSTLRVNALLLTLIILSGIRVALFAAQLSSDPLVYDAHASSLSDASTTPLLAEVVAPVVRHVAPPSAVKALYMTSWVAGTPTLRKKVFDLLDETEANAIVIDIKDYTGRISFEVHDPKLAAVGSVERRIADIRGLVDELHAKGIYVIGRISSFQDAYLASHRPDLAIHKLSDDGVWKDTKGVAWLDESNKEVWDYLVSIARESYAQGFDELNFDYVRFPSDGNLKDFKFVSYDPKTKTKAEQIKEFFTYLHKELAGTGPFISADLFGLTSSSKDDLGIGQVLENAAPYFDYIAPMIYPSHYASGFLNFKNPADHPYEVILSEMKTASERLLAASSTSAKLRPWLQDFNLGATYTPAMIRQEKKAVYDAGLTGWMMWSASNNYTKAALDLK